MIELNAISKLPKANRLLGFVPENGNVSLIFRRVPRPMHKAKFILSFIEGTGIAGWEG